MKKTLFFGLIAAALGFTACSSEDDGILGENIQKKGMVLNATVEQPAETRATIDNSAAIWQFAFAQDDVIKVTNSAVTSGTYYTFTNDGTNFKSTDATPTANDANWFAYFPSNSIDLTNQAGTKEGVANLYALAGTTVSKTTGENDLSITMSPKVAILKIDNQKGSIDISAKLYTRLWLKGMTASNGDFDVAISTSPVILRHATTKGTYYVAVPAGVQLAIKDGETVLKSTKAEGLAAGKYYNLTIGAAPTTGTAKRTGNIDVNWVQLWAGGPKFAEYNVGVTDGKPESYGGYYAWGGSVNKGNDRNEGTDPLTGNADTATKIWGSAWRMPTNEQLQGLLDNCNVEWTDDYNGTGVKGRVFTGNGTGYSSNSIFLPAAATFYNGSFENQGTGSYWSSTPNSDRTYRLYFLSGDQVVNTASRWSDHSVRAVLR